MTKRLHSQNLSDDDDEAGATALARYEELAPVLVTFLEMQAGAEARIAFAWNRGPGTWRWSALLSNKFGPESAYRMLDFNISPAELIIELQGLYCEMLASVSRPQPKAKKPAPKPQPIEEPPAGWEEW